MGVRPVDLMMVPQMTEVSHIKQTENMRPMAEQMNITAQVDKQAENKSEQVSKKDDVENEPGKFDAKEKSENEYQGRSGSRKRTFKEGKVFDKKSGDGGFDVKI